MYSFYFSFNITFVCQTLIGQPWKQTWIRGCRSESRFKPINCLLVSLVALPAKPTQNQRRTQSPTTLAVTGDVSYLTSLHRVVRKFFLSWKRSSHTTTFATTKRCQNATKLIFHPSSTFLSAQVEQSNLSMFCLQRISSIFETSRMHSVYNYKKRIIGLITKPWLLH